MGCWSKFSGVFDAVLPMMQVLCRPEWNGVPVYTRTCGIRVLLSWFVVQQCLRLVHQIQEDAKEVATCDVWTHDSMEEPAHQRGSRAHRIIT
jgi:hypothetical protein